MHLGLGSCKMVRFMIYEGLVWGYEDRGVLEFV